MRPLKLELEGFTAFRQPLPPLDFRDLDLFAITGPTGAGKSSLIDAITYALYGRVPRVAHQIGACISQGLSRMWVQLEFLAGEDRYRVFRETRRTGQRSIRLERWDGEDWAPVAGGARQVEERIEKIVGLDFEAFTRSVLLPQGHFQEFLAGDPAKRRDVLSRLLRLDLYEGVRKRASDRARDLRARMAGLQELLEKEYADATPETGRRLKQELTGLQTQAEAWERQIEQLARALELAQAVARARANLTETRRQQREVTSQQEAAEQLVREGDKEIEVREAALRDLEARLRANCFDPDRLSTLRLAAQFHQDLEKVQRDLAEARPALARAEEAVKTTRTEADAATGARAEGQAQLRAAEEDLQATITANAAAAVQRGLAPGDRCPVCGAPVTALPHIECPDLGQAQARREEAQHRERAERDRLGQAETRREVALTRCEEARRGLQNLEAAQEQRGKELAQALPDQDRSREAIQQALNQQQEAQKERAELEQQIQRTRDQLQELERNLARARGQLEALRGQAAALQQAAERAEGEFATHLESLRALAAGQDWSKDLAGLDAGEALESAVRSRLEAGRSQQGDLQTRIGQMRQQLEHLQARIARKKELEGELAGHRAEHDVAADLAQAMQANRFGAFVQSEALRVLADEGSRKLEGLSAGRYRLHVAESGQDFEVVDQWNADEARSVKTLSGGETFLASLGLALAMAETLPGLAPGQRIVLESIFIDEGFGSLDSEALGLAADVLDALRTDHRLVGVITHLKELADRLPVRIVVHKSETGSTVEVA